MVKKRHRMPSAANTKAANAKAANTKAANAMAADIKKQLEEIIGRQVDVRSPLGSYDHTNWVDNRATAIWQHSIGAAERLSSGSKGHLVSVRTLKIGAASFSSDSWTLLATSADRAIAISMTSPL